MWNFIALGAQVLKLTFSGQALWFCHDSNQLKTEPPHDKTNKMACAPSGTQISLGIRPVRSESSLCAQWIAKDPSCFHADSEDWSDWADVQAYLRLRCHFVGFVTMRLNWTFNYNFTIFDAFLSEQINYFHYECLIELIVFSAFSADGFPDVLAFNSKTEPESVNIFRVRFTCTSRNPGIGRVTILKCTLSYTFVYGYKNLSWVWGADRKKLSEGHCLASRGFTTMMDTFWSPAGRNASRVHSAKFFGESIRLTL